MLVDTICTVTIGKGDIVTLAFDGNRYEAPLQHSPLTREIVHRLDDFIRRIPTGPLGYGKDDLKLIGKVLFDILFGAEATKLIDDNPAKLGRVPMAMTLGALLDKRLLQFEQDEAAGRAESFRVSLALEDATYTLATYPWEFLFVDRQADQGFFLGERTLLTRVLRPATECSSLDKRLSVWVAWSQPHELGVISGADALGGKIIDQFGLDGVDYTPFPEMCWETLSAALGQSVPDILHIVAHGKVNGADSELAFRRSPDQMKAARSAAGAQPQQEVAQADWLGIATLADRLKDRPPRLVFLHACNLGRPAIGVESFKGAAEFIARAGVPFVIAMQYEITVADAELFATTFYAHVAKGAMVDDAVKAGRIALGRTFPEWAHRRFATPIVYLHDVLARLASPAIRPTVPSVPPLAMPSTQACPFNPCRSPNFQMRLGLKHCGCELRKPYIRCKSGHANEPDHVGLCIVEGCNETFEHRGAPAAPSGPPARAVPGGYGEA